MSRESEAGRLLLIAGIGAACLVVRLALNSNSHTYSPSRFTPPSYQGLKQWLPPSLQAPPPGTGRVVCPEVTSGPLTVRVEHQADQLSVAVLNRSKDKYIASAHLEIGGEPQDVYSLFPGQIVQNTQKISQRGFECIGSVTSFESADVNDIERAAEESIRALRLRGVESAKWVPLLERHYSPAARHALVLAAAAEIGLEPNGPFRSDLMPAFRQLADDESELSLLLNAGKRVQPLLEAARRAPPESVFRQQAVAVAKLVMSIEASLTTSNESLDALQRAARGFDLEPRQPPVISREVALKELARLLAHQPSEQVADLLVHQWLNGESSEGVAESLEKMPAFSIPAIAEAMEHPTGDERWFFDERWGCCGASISLRKKLEEEKGNLSEHLKSASRKYAEAREARAASLAAELRLPAGSEPAQQVNVARKLRTLSGPAGPYRDLIVSALVQGASAARPGEDEVLLDEALSLDPTSGLALAARSELEVRVLTRLRDATDADAMGFAGPSAAFETSSSPIPLAALPSVNGFTFYRSNWYPRWGPARLALDRIERADTLGLSLPLLLRWRAWWRGHGSQVLTGLLATVLLLALLTWRAPRPVGMAVVTLWPKAAFRLFRTASRRFPDDAQTLKCAAGYLEVAKRRRALVSEARTAVAQLALDDSVHEGIRGCLDFADEQRDFAKPRLEAVAGQSGLPPWLAAEAHRCLAIIALADGRDADAERHALLAGPRAKVSLAVARLRLGRPKTWGLWFASMGSPTLRLLLVHSLIDQRRFRLAKVLILRPRKPEWLYAKARLAQATFDRAGALSAFRSVLALKPGHRGALLGLAMLDGEAATRTAALTELGEGNDACAAVARLAAASELAGPEAVALLRPTSTHWSEARALASLQMQAGAFREASETLRKVAQLSGDERFLSQGSSALALKAISSGKLDAAAESARLAQSPLNESILAWTRGVTAVRRFREAPEAGLEAALAQSSAQGLEVWRLGLSEPLFHAVSKLAVGDTSGARDAALSKTSDDPTLQWLALVLSPFDVSAEQLSSAAERVRVRLPALSSTISLVESASLWAQGHQQQARAVLGRIAPSTDPADEASFARGVLSASMGESASEGLSKVATLALADDESAAIAAFDAISGRLSAPAVELRCALAAREAYRKLVLGDKAAALALLRAALSRVSSGVKKGPAQEAVRQALGVAEPFGWCLTVLDSPARALKALQATRANVHDSAIAAVAWVVQAPSEESLKAAVHHLAELAGDKASLAQHRLRGLQLAGSGAIGPRASFDEDVSQHLQALLRDLLEALMEVKASAVRAVVSQLRWKHAVLEAACEALEEKLGQTFRAVLENAENRVEGGKVSRSEATALLSEVEVAVERHLVELSVLGAGEAAVDNAKDSAAWCFDALSLGFYKGFERSGSLAQRAVERALEFERAAHVRERLTRNLRIMANS